MTWMLLGYPHDFWKHMPIGECQIMTIPIKTSHFVFRDVAILLSVACVSKYGHARLQSLYLNVNGFPQILDLWDRFQQYTCLM